MAPGFCWGLLKTEAHSANALRFWPELHGPACLLFLVLLHLTAGRLAVLVVPFGSPVRGLYRIKAAPVARLFVTPVDYPRHAAAVDHCFAAWVYSSETKEKNKRKASIFFRAMCAGEKKPPRWAVWVGCGYGWATLESAHLGGCATLAQRLAGFRWAAFFRW